ncbi:alpha/beta hydrolase [Rhodophyticola sp. CCM32]|uniref:alpha/beta hydrolase n=1 Tax=Rhodophyticola sp. CCM32 TaxID=2916397 RepID=UPI00107FAF7D|nr:alpha/beta hydrolase [Rhodophyticola sp. CCM32]QBY02020.1 alpha/beta hydrolase [Rhodophyticola sp. CCM32]
MLMDDIGRITDVALALPGADGRVALLGHSMASAGVLRQARVDDRVAAVILLSPVSQMTPAELSENVLIISGVWDAVSEAGTQQIMAAQGAEEGAPSGAPGNGQARRAFVAPMAEHVGVLYSGTGMGAARDWLNTSFDREYRSQVAAFGRPVLFTLLGIVLLGIPLARVLPEGRPVPEVPTGAFWTLILVPLILTPLILSLVEIRVFPVLGVDYLALHLAIYGALMLAGLAVEGDLPKQQGWWIGLFLAAYGLLVFGGVLDRYVLSFWPNAERLPILCALLPGAGLLMVADAALLQGGTARLWRFWVARLVFLVSLWGTIALDAERMGVLIILLPVIGVFYLSFGVMGGCVGRRTGSVMGMGLGLGVLLAWVLAVTLPMVSGGT